MASKFLFNIMFHIVLINAKISIGESKCSPTSDCDSSCCVLLIKCPAHVRIPSKKCVTGSGQDGVCCRTGSNFTDVDQENKLRGNHYIQTDPITLNIISRRSRAKFHEMRLKEERISSKSSILRKSDSSYGHFRNSRISSVADLHQVMTVASKALEIALATKAFRDRMGITAEQLELNMIQNDLSSTPLASSCASTPFCYENFEKYRRIDGACNNLNRPSWGSHFTPYSRLLPPSYEDGVWLPRRSKVDGEPLESPREISVELFTDDNNYHSSNTQLVMQFGQFLAHDITQSVDSSFRNGSAVGCCKVDGSGELEESSRHYACYPIKIHKNDPFFSIFQRKCMNFVRSVLAPRKDCTLGYAEQMNKVTHFIDGSMVYGSTVEQTGKLRSFRGGKLAAFDDFGRDLLPLNEDGEACSSMEHGTACFDSGDTRTNQMVTLVALHTLFLRQHNRIASILAQINPNWSDELLFLEARRIIVAQLQVIVYKEFLPAIIGHEAMEHFQLNLQENSDYSHDYKADVEPSILNEFASAAFRFGHSIVDGQLKAYGTKKMEEVIFIPETMFKPGRMRKRHFFDQILSSLTTEPVQEVDEFFSDALTKYMFRGGNPFGVDLVSLNIQRGRDHGLRPYNDYRKLLGLPPYDFEDFRPKIAESLRKVYKSVEDVDLYVGGLMESEKPKGSAVGTVFTQIIAEQFSRLKHGDRYFFENDPEVNPGHFTKTQLNELRKTTMSRIICDNSDGILLGKQALNAFKRPGIQGNEIFDCSNTAMIPVLNLIHWKEN